MKDLSTLRDNSNEIDNKIVELWAQRMECSLKIAEYKKENNLPVIDEKREKELLDRVGAMAGEELDHYCRELYEKIMTLSRDYQQKYFDKDNV